MPALKTYDIFISHAWTYSKDYYNLVDLLNSAANFKWRNYSVPSHNPVIDPSTEAGKRALKKELDQQIRPVNCVLVISGMYATYREWIQNEMDLASGYNKPIIGVIPWGQERVSTAVSSVAKQMVRWNTDSIVAAIRKWSI